MAEHLDLYPSVSLLIPLPDESLFSLVSRHHFLWGNAISSTTSNQFFCHPRNGAQHDFPNRLQVFVDRTGGVYGNAREVALNLTLLKFYQPFLSQEGVSDAIECLSHGRIALLRLKLGVLTSRFGANHPLKACPVCMREDLVGTGWAYWHLKHQYPGVWVCIMHGVPLLQSKSTGVGRFQWVLPRLDELHDSLNESARSITLSLDALASFAELIDAVVLAGTLSKFEVDRFYEHYRAEFMSRGWLSALGHMRLNAIATSFLNHVQPFQFLEEFAGFPMTLRQASLQLGRLFNSPRTKTHPFRHLMMIHWLFGTWERFSQSKYVAMQTAMEVGLTQLRAEGEVDARKKEFDALVREKKFSPKAAASSIGIDPQTALIWAAKLGIAVQRRPKILLPDLRKLAVKRLRRGAEKSAVATEVGVSIQTISRLLWTEVGLQQAWTEARLRRTRDRARKAWARLLKTSGPVGVKWMRTIEPATYAWLYRNDHLWLAEHSPCPNPSHRRPCTACVDWKARDEQLSVAIEQACLVLQERGEHLKHVNQLYPLVPQLHAKRRHLNALPLTRLAIQRSIGDRHPGMSDLLA
ncbi:hypothetical protein HNP48_001941 [Acidovorax soli]|uniref:TniQ protein n=1 Tax=Acidovorax soli TaxID=592050 RepID=A0A7X0U8Y0_9BURK|nr:TnsD family Tn7-like transposition protein [Acidovorax soli]MBB6559274.1 hypothetical protein [Acidovorax soli]